MKRNRTILTACAALLAALLGGCAPDTPHSPDVTLTGDDWFFRYQAVGSSMTAGFMDGGLMLDGQLGSYPALIARQMGKSVAVSSSAAFTQPYIARPGIGVTPVPAGFKAGCLYWTGTGVALLGTTPEAQVPQLALMALLPSAYGNLAVPAATTRDVLQALSATDSQVPGNAYFNLILRNPTFGNVTMLNQTIYRRPTLVTLWIGAEEILNAAATGAPALGVNLTPGSLFGDMFDQIVESLQIAIEQGGGEAPLIVAGNLPALVDIPYFMPKTLFDYVATEGEGTVPTVEADAVYVRFPALSYLGGGGTPPLGPEWTLSAAEAFTVDSLIESYNTNIASVCGERGVPVVDLGALFAELNEEGMEGLTGGLYPLGNADTAFSLDGIHPNNRGHGLIANAFIAAINAAAGAALAPVDVAGLTWDPTYGQDDD